MTFYVNASAPVGGDGSKDRPFNVIQAAADIARPGDEVLVFPGIYREHVNPKCGGTEDKRITYRSVEPLGAVITGAEPLTNWTDEGNGVWTARVSNDLFGDYNPYTTLVAGDWFNAAHIAHTGDVCLNGKSMYEVTDMSGVLSPEMSPASWDPDFSLYTWFAEQGENETIFHANFGDKNPNEETVEIFVRRSCFAPEAEGIGYITLSGFTVCMAATQWAPPTAYQEGMIAPHWSKGWIIEDCEIYESKCSGISLGKYRQETNDNKWLKWKYKDGTQTERECICLAQVDGWSKETIGSHIVRRCCIHNCGQTGIVGHLGGVFSLIEDNVIYDINNKQNLAGAEIGGIKMHAAIDVIIRRNHIYHCTRGLWLDWQAQGTRVTQNLFHDNTVPHLPNDPSRINRSIFEGMGEDIFVEVSHGPTLIDNNILLSARALKLASQGLAVVHNLIAGGLVAIGRGTDNGAKTLASPRYTPYHMPHRCEVAGFMTFLHGDARFYNNIFIQQPMHPVLEALMGYMKDQSWEDGNVVCGTFPYDGYPTFEEWDKEFEGYCGMGSDVSDRYYMHLPVWMGGNVYFNGARPWEKEKDFISDTEHEIRIGLKKDGNLWYLDTNLYDVLPEMDLSLIDTEKLGFAFEPEEKFENPDGTPLTLDTDYFGNTRHEGFPAGPFANRKEASKKLW